MRSFSLILSHTKTSVPFGDFYISVSRLRSIHLMGIERSREARYPNLISIELFLYQDKRSKKIRSDFIMHETSSSDSFHR